MRPISKRRGNGAKRAHLGARLLAVFEHVVRVFVALASLGPAAALKVPIVAQALNVSVRGVGQGNGTG